MRLKSADGPMSVYNGNDSGLLNSPKRINTLHNSNITNRNVINHNISTDINNINSNKDLISTLDITDNNIENANTSDSVQWCNSALNQNFEQANNTRNKTAFNINNNLAASLKESRYGTASSVCSESPDDSLLDYEEANRSISSIDESPQDEDRGFDVSDTESISDDVNLNIREALRPRGIVNPNYPGFQHLAHTLDYSIKVSSDTDFTDDDLEYESVVKLNAEANSINNNNEDDVEYKIDSVNRLNSVENIQKVFYDKPVLNIPLQCDSLECNNCVSEVASACHSYSNQNSDNCSQVSESKNIQLNIFSNEKVVGAIDVSNGTSDIVGDFGKEVQDELNKLNEKVSKNKFDDKIAENSEINELPPIEKTFVKAIEEELKEAIERLSTLNDLEPSAIHCKIEPNVEQPFNKKPISKAEISEVILQESKVVKQNNIEMNAVQTAQRQENFDVNFFTSLSEREKLTSKFSNLQKEKQLQAYDIKVSDAFLSGVYENLHLLPNKSENICLQTDFNANSENTKMEIDGVDLNSYSGSEKRLTAKIEHKKKSKVKEFASSEEMEKFCKEEMTKYEKEKDEDTIVPRKKEKMEANYFKKRKDYNHQYGSLITVQRKDSNSRARDTLNRRSVPVMKEKKKYCNDSIGGFDVYNIETAMPKIDLDAIESHLRAAREEERRRRTDREEIRRRLAMGSEDDYYSDRPGRKPSLQSRLQSGMNLQICFMNETASDTDSPSSDSECPMTNPKELKLSPKTKKSLQEFSNSQFVPPIRPATLSIGQSNLEIKTEITNETDFFTKQARLQTEARMALAQAKEMARMQMEIERQKQIKSPITEMVRHSLEKVGIPFPENRRRLSRQILTEMNVAQLQVIVNDLHTQIENLNEALVKFLMERDDLHMEQDSMLVDIEDLTRYLGAKEQTVKEQNISTQNNNLISSTALSSPARSPLAALNSSVKPHLSRIANLVKK